MGKPRLLVIDDGETYAGLVRDHMPEFELVHAGGKAHLPDGPAALEYLTEHPGVADVVLLDLHFDVGADRLLPLGKGESPRRTKRYQGVAIFRELRRAYPALPVVLLTSLEDLALADLADELRAQSLAHFLDRNDVDTLRIRVNDALRSSTFDVEENGVLWGADPAMRRVRRRLGVLARGSLPVILEGETGTGKSFLAERFLHTGSGRTGPFITVDLSTIPADLVAAHLFGAMRGSFTGAVNEIKGVFELADKGTLFIDEIHNIPLDVQRQLLLVLQDRRVRPLGARRDVSVDVKVVAASNAPLADAVAAGRFRSDLYMRLSPSTRVIIPPLRERPGDLAFLAQRFAHQAVRDAQIAQWRDDVATALGLTRGASIELVLGRSRKVAPDSLALVVPDPAWAELRRHPWPGNIRELTMVVQNLVTFTLVGAVDALQAGVALRSTRLQVDPGLVGELLAGSASAPVSEGAGDLDPSEVRIRIEAADTFAKVSTRVEKQYLLELHRRFRGDLARMAEVLLGDASRERAVQLRLNQVGLKLRELRRS